VKEANGYNHIIFKIALLVGDEEILDSYCEYHRTWKDEVERNDILFLALARCENEISTIFIFKHFKIYNLKFQEKIDELSCGLKYLIKENIIDESNFCNEETKDLVRKYSQK